MLATQAMPDGPVAVRPVPAHEEDCCWRPLAFALAGLLAHRPAAEPTQPPAAAEQHVLQDRDRLLDLVAHELKTPVAVVRAYAELLDAQTLQGAPPGDVRQVVGHILEQTEVMAALVEELLDVQRLRLGKLPLELARVDLLALARSVGEELQQTTEAHCIRVLVDEAPPVLVADRRRLRQVLTNLLENAVKYAEGGPIEVRVGVRERSGRPHAIVAIRDEGPGIDAGDLTRIFARFEQLAAAPVRGHRGLGLGLYVAREIVRAHGGELWAESPGRGRGSTFTVAVPLDGGPGGS